jgi:mannitol-1-phosphate 5-dehydrogenase
VNALVTQALDETSQALAAEHGLDPVALAENIQDLLSRFGNRSLGDPISRLARDPLRKLAADDRLTGAARLAQRHDILPQGLSWGIAAALAYDDPADPHAAQLQAMLAGQGMNRVLQDVCGIQPDEPLAEMVRENYRLLHTDPQWRK